MVAGTGPQDQQWPLIALVILAAGILRGSLLFGSSLMPGMNGGYYLVQARVLLTHGSLGLPDLPLIFYVQASLARAVSWISGRDLDSCILFSVKLTDSLLPALVALPVALLVRRWAKAAGAPAWLAPAAAATVVLSAPILDMVGNFEKNSLGLLWLCLLLLFIHLWLTRPCLPRAAGVVCFWGLAALTHIGVFGASVMFGGLAMVFFLVGQRGPGWRTLWPLLAAALVVGAIAAGTVLWKFDGSRIQRLAVAVAHPADYLAGGNMGAGHQRGRPARTALACPAHRGPGQNACRGEARHRVVGGVGAAHPYRACSRVAGGRLAGIRGRFFPAVQNRKPPDAGWKPGGLFSAEGAGRRPSASGRPAPQRPGTPLEPDDGTGDSACCRDSP